MPSDGQEKPVDPVVAAADRRIKQRGLQELQEIVTLMGLDPDYAPDPLHVVEAGIVTSEQDTDFVIPPDLYGELGIVDPNDFPNPDDLDI